VNSLSVTCYGADIQIIGLCLLPVKFARMRLACKKSPSLVLPSGWRRLTRLNASRLPNWHRVALTARHYISSMKY